MIVWADRWVDVMEPILLTALLKVTIRELYWKSWVVIEDIERGIAWVVLRVIGIT